MKSFDVFLFLQIQKLRFNFISEELKSRNVVFEYMLLEVEFLK